MRTSLRGTIVLSYTCRSNARPDNDRTTMSGKRWSAIFGTDRRNANSAESRIFFTINIRYTSRRIAPHYPHRGNTI